MRDDSIYMDSLREIVSVVDVKDGLVMVEKERNSACDTCQLSETCPLIVHTSHPDLNTSTARVRVANPKGIHVNRGDKVLIELKGKWISTKLSLIVYVFPLIVFLTGIFIGEYTIFKPVSSKDLYSTLFGTLLMLISFFIVRIIDRHFARVGKFIPILVKKLNT